MSGALAGSYSSTEQALLMRFNTAAHAYEQEAGREALRQACHSLFQGGDNRGRRTFGKTDLEHLERQYRNTQADLFVRVVAYAKVHAAYPKGLNLSQAVCVLEPGGLREELLAHEQTAPESKDSKLRRALTTAKQNRMLDASSSLTRLVLPAGEWSTLKTTF